MAGQLAPLGKQGLQGLPHTPGRTWGDGSLTGPCSPLDPPLHHTKPHCLPGDRHPLALDLDTPALTPGPLCSALGLVGSLSSHPPPGSHPLHSKHPPMRLGLLPEGPPRLGHRGTPTTQIDLQELWGCGGQMNSWVCDYSQTTAPGWQKRQVSRVGRGRSASEPPPSPRSKDSPSGSVSIHQLPQPREGGSPGITLLGLRPGGQGGEGDLLRRELFRLQLERWTSEKAASTASPLLTAAGLLQAKKRSREPGGWDSWLLEASGSSSPGDGATHPQGRESEGLGRPRLGRHGGAPSPPGVLTFRRHCKAGLLLYKSIKVKCIHHDN